MVASTSDVTNRRTLGPSASMTERARMSTFSWASAEQILASRPGLFSRYAVTSLTISIELPPTRVETDTIERRPNTDLPGGTGLTRGRPSGRRNDRSSGRRGRPGIDSCAVPSSYIQGGAPDRVRGGKLRVAIMISSGVPRRHGPCGHLRPGPRRVSLSAGLNRGPPGARRARLPASSRAPPVAGSRADRSPGAPPGPGPADRAAPVERGGEHRLEASPRRPHHGTDERPRGGTTARQVGDVGE